MMVSDGLTAMRDSKKLQSTTCKIVRVLRVSNAGRLRGVLSTVSLYASEEVIAHADCVGDDG